MPTTEVLTVSESAPAAVLDAVLTAVERALHEAGASRVWVDDTSRAITVMAELPESD